MKRAPEQLLLELERVVREYGSVATTAHKRELLGLLEGARFRRASELYRFHEAVCFLRAQPDDRELLSLSERVLARFEGRADLLAHREALRDSGIAGTAIHFPFHWVTARWLLRHWPERLSVDWDAFGEREHERFERLLPLLLPYAEYPDFELPLSAADWLARLSGPDETDATFLLRRFLRLRSEPRVREASFHDLGMPLRLAPGPDGPSRSRAFCREAPRAFQSRPLSRERPRLVDAVKLAPQSVRELSRREGVRVIELAREAMITRSRDLDGIMYASPDDVRMVDAGEGLGLACLGLLPEQRALIETIYVFLLLKNGVPIGYYQSALLFGSAELNYNVFPSFRGGETARVYARSLAVVHHMFGSNAFSVHPYQLGRENPDALASGAFWFYGSSAFSPSIRRSRARWDASAGSWPKIPASLEPKSPARASDGVPLLLPRATAGGCGRQGFALPNRALRERVGGEEFRLRPRACPSRLLP